MRQANCLEEVALFRLQLGQSARRFTAVERDLVELDLNVSLVEQTSTAAATLEDESRRLAGLIDTFKVDAAQAKEDERKPDAPIRPVAEPARTERQRSAEKPHPASRAVAKSSASPRGKRSDTLGAPGEHITGKLWYG